MYPSRGSRYVKLVSPDQLIQQREQGKVLRLTNAFEAAYKTSLAMILIDDVERLLEFTRVDNIARFSNMVLQALLVLLKRRPPSSCRLMVVVATSLLRQMKRLHLDAAFAAIVQLPGVAAPDGLKTILHHYAGGIKPDVLDEIALQATGRSIAVKHFLIVLAAARQECGKDDGAITARSFLAALELAPANDEGAD